jgi:ATP-dependent exoDNAse (exonuclease V) alpha subunit
MSSDIVCVNGVAGAGKTFMMNAARECMEAVGKRVIGTTLSANAAAGLEKGSGIKSVHIHKLLRDIEDGHLSLDAKTTLVLDEAGMVSTRQMEKIAGIVNAAGAKLVLVGDHRQLQAIGAGAPFRLISELVGVTELNQIVRQREQRDRTLVYDLRDGRAEKALTSLAERGNLTIRDKRDELLSEVVSSWVEHPRNKAESLIFAGTNADVSAINRLCQLERLARHELSDDSVVVNGARICTHDRVMITRNHRGLMVRNGTLGEVTSTQGGQLRVRLDDGTQISLDPVHFPHVKLGYAMSIHKAQGATCERAFVMTSDSMTDREWSYVAGSRARGETRVFAQAEFVDDEIQRLADKMSRSRAKDMAHEHLLEGVS